MPFAYMSNDQPEPFAESDQGESPADPRSQTIAAIRRGVVNVRPDWRSVERLIRDYAHGLRAADVKRDRAVSELRSMVIKATGDPSSDLVRSAETWTIDEYYRK